MAVTPTSDTEVVNLSPADMAQSIHAKPLMPKPKSKRKPTPTVRKTATRAKNRNAELREDNGKLCQNPLKKKNNKKTTAKPESNNVDDGAPTRKIGGRIPPPVFDVRTPDGIRERLEWIAQHGRDAESIKACKDLLAHHAAQPDPNEAVDPASVCAVLARCHLYGEDPARVLMQTHGLRKVAKALVRALGLARISITFEDNTVEYCNVAQCTEGSATDGVSVGGGAGDASIGGGHPPGADH